MKSLMTMWPANNAPNLLMRSGCRQHGETANISKNFECFLLKRTKDILLMKAKDFF